MEGGQERGWARRGEMEKEWSWVHHWAGENNGLGVIKGFLLNRFPRRNFYNSAERWNSEEPELFYEKVYLLKEHFLLCSDPINQWGQVSVHSLQLGGVTEACFLVSRLFWVCRDSSDMCFIECCHGNRQSMLYMVWPKWLPSANIYSFFLLNIVCIPKWINSTKVC